MPTNRKRQRRSIKALKPWERAYLTGDDSDIIPGSRAAARLITMRDDLDGWLMFGDRTGRQLLQEFPEYRR
ncbi:MAG: hypothetical protein ABR533_12285 [Desulfonatronovibrio sp.]